MFFFHDINFYNFQKELTSTALESLGNLELAFCHHTTTVSLKITCLAIEITKLVE